MRVPKGFVQDGKTIGETKLRYRMLADGVIIDQENQNRMVGYVDSRFKRENIWSARGNAKQKMIRDFLSE